MTERKNINRRDVDMARFTIVVVDLVTLNTALSPIQQQPGFGASLLPWIVIIYGLLFGSFMLLGARVATAALAVVPARTAAGSARNAALGVFGGAAVASATIGVLAHRLLPAAPAWHRTVFVHLPTAMVLGGLAFRLLPRAVVQRAELELEAKRAMLVTGATTLVVYGLHSGIDLGWCTRSTLALLASGTIALIASGWIESRRQQSFQGRQLREPPAPAPPMTMKPSSTQGMIE